MKKRYISFIICGVLFSALAPLLFIQKWTDHADFHDTGQIGDTIGGTTAPIIGLLSILLLFSTLWEQIKFNKKQKEISADEQFKSTFFNLLQVQRDIIDKISGKFKYLGLMAYDEISEPNNSIKIKKGHNIWATIIIENAKDELSGLDFFKSAKYQLELIYDALDNKEYLNNYNIEEAFNAENYLESEYISGTNIPQDFQEEQDEKAHDVRRSFRIKYTNDKYGVSKEMHDKYQKLSIDKKIAFGYAYFFYKYENMGYYFRHLYRILKFIKMNEDEKILSLGKNPKLKDKDEIREHFRQYAQFIQAQMSTYELLLLYYNSFSFNKAQSLIIHYGLLENLTIQNLIKKEHNCIPELKLKDKASIFLDLIK